MTTAFYYFKFLLWYNMEIVIQLGEFIFSEGKSTGGRFFQVERMRKFLASREKISPSQEKSTSTKPQDFKMAFICSITLITFKCGKTFWAAFFFK